jgi:hypothetical protein
MIRYPNIIGNTDTQKLEQMKSYLHQLADELNFQLEKGGSLQNGYLSTAVDVAAVAKPVKKDNAISNFNDIKALIIKSADIVDAYYADITELINKNNLYAAYSDFGDFKQETNNILYADGKSIRQEVSDIQTIFDTDGNILDARICHGQIYSGLFEFEGETVVGLRIGQRNMDASGNTTFQQFAQFTAKELAFFDSNSTKVAYISDRKLYIPEAVIKTQLTMGHFVDIVQANGSIVTKYVKGGS